MTKKRNVSFIAGVSLLALFIIFGCTLRLQDDSKEDDWYIKMNIDIPAAAKAITVTEYAVTGLAIEVYDPQDQLIDTITWGAEEGLMSYQIPVSQEGLHKLEVTHIGEENGEVVEAEECATFNIQAMVITVIDIIPGCIGVINIEPGEPQQPQEDGTVTVTFTDADIANGHRALVGVYPAGADPMIDPMGQVLASGDFEIESGYGSQTLVVGFSGPDIWYGTGGESYDVYIWVDMNDNLECGVCWQEPDIDLQLSSFPVVVVIQGDVYLNYTGSDFVVVPRDEEPLLVSPSEGAILDNGRTDRNDSIVWDFDWSDVPEAERYHLYVIGPSAIYPVIDCQNVMQSSYQFVRPGSYIVVRLGLDWTWKVRAMVNGSWGNWSEVRSFDVEPVDTDPPSG